MVQVTKVVLQSLHNSLFILRNNSPNGNRPCVAAFMGIGNIKVVLEYCFAGAVTVQYSNTGGATIDPAAKPLIPTVLTFNGKDGDGIGFLCKQKDLLIESKTEVMAGSR